MSLPQSTAQFVGFSKEQPNLDLVRATAVLSVALAHLYERMIGQTSEVAWHFGQMGVLIFFVHTACVLMWSLERSARHLSGRALWYDFYIRRTVAGWCSLPPGRFG